LWTMGKGYGTMPDDSVTLGLSGEVPSSLFARAMQHFDKLIQALTTELAKQDAFDWILDDLQFGSATVTIRAEAKRGEDLDRIDRVVRAYTDIGRKLERDEPLLYSEKVIKEAQGIVSLLNGHITAVRFETAETEATIISPLTERLPKRTYMRAYDAIEGRVQTLTNRKGLRFALYDSFYDHAVSCYLVAGQEELMRDVWDRRAIVEGWVSRDPFSGRPVAIRRITDIKVLDDVRPGSYREARGALSGERAQLPPEERIRRARRMAGQVRDAR